MGRCHGNLDLDEQVDLGVSKNSGIYPQIIHFNRLFHINHPFWGTLFFGNTQLEKHGPLPRMARGPGFRDSISRSCVVSSFPTDIVVIPLLDRLESSGPCGCFKKKGTPKWMVKIMENPINPWMIWGISPTIFGNIHVFFSGLYAIHCLFCSPLFHSKALFLPLCLQFEGFGVLSQN